ncbi:MAG: putative Ig domain-containing protein, partial [Candidatus Sulfotelmatobacter sp.]
MSAKRTAFILTVVLLAIPMYGAVGITTTTLPNGIENSAYSATVTAPGGCYPYVWEIASGSLPPGLTGKGTSNTDTYTITGTPTSSGTFNFTVQVEGCGRHTSSYAYSVTMQPNSASGQISPDFFGMHVNDLSNPWPTTVGIQFKNYRTHNSSATLWSQL